MQGYKLSLGGESSIVAFDTAPRANNLIKKLNIIGNGFFSIGADGVAIGNEVGRKSKSEFILHG